MTKNETIQIIRNKISHFMTGPKDNLIFIKHGANKSSEKKKAERSYNHVVMSLSLAAENHFGEPSCTEAAVVVLEILMSRLTER